jgi:biotin carboxylase
MATAHLNSREAISKMRRALDEFVIEGIKLQYLSQTING